MSAADIPANEAQRLAVLRSLDILGSEQSSDFKNLVKLVEQVFDVPMVAVSFVDEKRQWFKSSVGLPVCETRREVSFCAHVIACSEPVIVEDAMLDERFFDNPMVTGEPYLKFYAGVPLAPFDEAILGTLCIMSDKPRGLSDRDYNLLIQFARQVETLICHHFDKVKLNAIREKERDQHEVLLSIINASSNPILVRKPKDNYFLANNSALEALEVDSIKGAVEVMTDTLGAQQKLTVEDIDQRVMATGMSEQTRVRLANGRYYDVTKSRLAVSGQKVMGIVTVAHDVTELVRSNAKLEEQQQLLELMHDAEKRASNAKSDFLSSMSHELKTPLHSIAGFSQLLLKSKKESLSEKQRNHVHQIYESSDYLLSLINDVLELAKIEAGFMPVDMACVSLKSVVDEVTEAIKVLPAAEGISIRLNANNDDELTVYADEKRLRQVFYNLLSNAVKYNSVNGAVEIKWRHLDSGMVQVEIKDTGVGISAEKEPQLFQSFNRLGQEDNEAVDGTGVGLSLTQKIVERLQGRMGFSSTEGKGSTFWFELREGQ